jgi:hypothetical protein
MAQPPKTVEEQRMERAMIAAAVALGLIGLFFIAIAVVLAIFVDATAPTVEVVRDYLIIVMALEMVIIGAAIVVFLIQLARFINLLNNEIKPLVDTTSETLNIVKGTATFMSKYMAEPVIEANAKAAGVAKALKDLDAIRKALNENGSRAETPDTAAKNK